MRANEFIVEAATSILYHFTSVQAAAAIFTDDAFKLSSVTGSQAEKEYSPPGYPYFLSTSRSRMGDYSRYVGDSAVMFVLNGNYLSASYPVKPIDYWNRAWLSNPGRSSESEDRIFSKQPAISIDSVTAIHVLMQEGTDYTRPLVRRILISAKKKGVKTYFYTDAKAWALQDTRKVVSPANANIKGNIPVKTMYRMPSNYLSPWIELIHKKKKSELSDRAEELRYNLVYYGPRHLDSDQNLGVDMFNARKPNATDYQTAVKINDYMRKNKFSTTVELKNALTDKWTAIK
jgi:hypothetical protein